MKAARYLFFCLVAIAHTGAALHAAASPVNEQVDAVFKAIDNPNTPGASIAVIANGQIVLEKGYGIANLEYAIPIKPDTIFHVASVSKQFTAMAIVLLEQDRKLSIDDDVHKYLPELPDYGYKITIRNLLTHTSGICDQWQTLGLAGRSLEDVITQDQILRMLFRQKELNFPPGTRFLYSNGGFTLLAEIVTRVSGEPFPQFCAERIFAPLGMMHTHFHQDLTQLVPNRASSYNPKGKGFTAAPLNYANVGATSLFTTASDIAVVSNLGSFNPDQAARAVAAVYIGDKMAVAPKPVEPKYIRVGPKDLEAFVGVYPLPAIGQTLTAVIAQGKLLAAGQIQPPLELRPVGPRRFYVRELQAAVEFEPRKNGGMGVKITQPAGVNQGERLSAADAAIKPDLSPYTGVYWSEELETQYTFFVRDGTLFGLQAHHGEFRLLPTIKDQFSSDQWFTPRVKFARDAENHLVSVTLGADG